MTALLIVFFGLALILGIGYPSYFLLFYILATSKFLGFLDPASFIVGGVELGYFGLNLITIFSVFFQSKWYVMPRKIQGFIYFIILMLSYGVIKPYLDDNSSILLAFIASKDTWFYFLFLYIIVYRYKINNLLLLNSLKYLGIYLSLIYIIGKISVQLVPPVYYNGSYVRTFFPTYISLAVFIYTIRIKYYDTNNIKDRFIIVILLLGLFLAAHLSLTLMTVIGVILYQFIYDKKLQLNQFFITRFAVISIVIIALTFASVNGLFQKVSSDVEAIISGENNSLNARDIYNEFRWEAIRKKKKLGYGFIHQSSSYMKEVKIRGNNRFMERFTVIDSGYVDLLIKFGYLGSALIMLVLAFYYSQGFFIPLKNPLSLAMSIYLMQYFFINYTWSVFTFAHGIVPGIIALHLLLTSNDEEEGINEQEIEATEVKLKAV